MKVAFFYLDSDVLLLKEHITNKNHISLASTSFDELDSLVWNKKVKKRKIKEDINSNNDNSKIFESESSKHSTMQIEWHKQPFTPNIFPFNESSSGFKVSLIISSSPLEFFKLFFSEELVSSIVDKTNIYYKKTPKNYKN
jgi:hypothetical protein